MDKKENFKRIIIESQGRKISLIPRDLKLPIDLIVKAHPM